MYEKRGVNPNSKFFDRPLLNRSIECNEYMQENFYHSVINPISEAFNEQLDRHCKALIAAGESPNDYVIEYDSSMNDLQGDRIIATLSAVVRPKTEEEKLFKRRHLIGEWVEGDE